MGSVCIIIVVMALVGHQMLLRSSLYNHNAMNIKNIVTSFLAVGLLASCSDDEPGGGVQPEAGKYQLSGKVEKGPFVRGSSISVQPLNASLNAIGTVFNGEITDDAGTFNLGQIELASQFVRITTDGYYFNEVTGNLSSGTLHLVALADLSDRSSVNVNILTHLKSARIQKLMQSGKTFAEADKQAQKELLTQFGLQAYENTPAETMTITAGTDGSGVLIAISSIVLSDRTDAEITQYLSTLSQDLADDGSFTEDNMKTVFQGKNRVTQDLEKLGQNIKDRYGELGMIVTIPDLRYFFDWNNDGIAGNEINDNVQVSLSQSDVAFGKDGGEVSVTVTSNIPLSLEQYSDPYGDGNLDVTPPNVSTEDSFFSDVYIDEGKPMSCVYTFENNILKIKVAKTEKRHKQSTSIPLYDMMGVCQATVNVTLDGDPSIEVKLGDTGVALLSTALQNLYNAISWPYYVERGYTGMYKFFDVNCPFRPDDNYCNRAYTEAYNGVGRNTQMIKSIESVGYNELATPFKLSNIIIYTELVDKWGRIGIVKTSDDGLDFPVQQTAEYTLRYLESELDKISSEFTDKKAACGVMKIEDVQYMSKDLWRVAKVNVYMALGEYNNAASYLQQIVDSKWYNVEPGNEYDANNGSMLFLPLPYDVLPEFNHNVSYYNYADVLLTLAECYHATGNESKATSLINQVASKKDITTSGNSIADIDNIRKKLFIPRYFAFQKRNNLGEYAEYQKLWPIPTSELYKLPGWTQNPGY